MINMRKMLPTKKTFFLNSDQRLDSARRRKMTRRLKTRFLFGFQDSVGLKQALQRSTFLCDLLALLGLNTEEQEYDLPLQLIRKRRSAAVESVA